MIRADPFLCGHGMLVTIVQQDIAHMSVLAGTDLKCHGTSGFQSFLAIALYQ